MLVYGDRRETVDPRAFGQALAARCAALGGDQPRLRRHIDLVGLLIDAGKLAQGLADSAFELRGVDDGAFATSDAATFQIGRQVAMSWTGDPPPPPHVESACADLIRGDLPEAVTLREPEGYAFYAVYPELYLVAARAFMRDAAPAVVGLRSIGASLGVVAAVGVGAAPPMTLRPLGEPFDRKLALGEGLRLRLERSAADGVLVVDEGPGASGSSFGAVGDLLDDIGLPPERVTYMPSHAEDLGPQASDRHRARWRTADKAYASFEAVILPRLPTWVEPLVGPLTEPLRDLSGGLWREVAGEAPAWPAQERRKYLATTTDGYVLLKFAGLGAVGERKLERAQALHAAGFTPKPLGLAHGFLVERWEGGATDASLDARVTETVGDYLAFRSRALAPPPGAAAEADLRAMMRRNLSLAGLPELAAIAGGLSAGRSGPPCAIDGRLHAWEWRRLPGGRWIKCDALDHCEAHDLIGAQDVAWDVAGAAVEAALDPGDAERLRRIVEAQSGRPVDPRRLEFQTLAYLAFQLGWWTLAAQTAGAGQGAAAQVRRYTDRAKDWRPHT